MKPMVWHFDPSGNTMDVYDHTGSLIAEDVTFSGSWNTPPGYPEEIIDVMRDQFNPSSNPVYSLNLLFDLLIGDIRKGTP